MIPPRLRHVPIGRIRKIAERHPDPEDNEEWLEGLAEMLRRLREETGLTYSEARTEFKLLDLNL